MAKLYELKKYHDYSFENLVNLILELEKREKSLKNDIEEMELTIEYLNQEIGRINHSGYVDVGWK